MTHPLVDPGAPVQRRLVLRATAALTLAGLARPAASRVLDTAATAPSPTPRLTDGPFYPVAFAAAPSRTLVVGPLLAAARPLVLAGRVVDRQGRAIGGSRIEIWQCDTGRHYHHPADAAGAALDPGFAGFGWQASEADGGYRFGTIRPVAYPGRTPHIHVKVKVDGRSMLSTQIFMPDEDAANRADFLWRDLGRAQPLALATLVEGTDRDSARFDIVLP